MRNLDSRSKKLSNEREVDNLIEIVRSDPKRRYESLVSLKKIGNPKAIDTFYKRLNDPSPRIRKISIEALGEMGDKSAIDHLSIVVGTHDFWNSGMQTNYGHTENVTLAKESIQKIQRRFRETPKPINDGLIWTDEDIQSLRQFWGGGKSIQIIADLLKRRPDAVVHKLIETALIGYNDDNCYPRPARFGFKWNAHERAQLISEINAGKRIPEVANIHQRNKNSILHSIVALKIINYNDRSLLEQYTDKDSADPKPDPKPLGYKFDDTLTGKRPIKSEDAKQHELIFIGRLEKKFEENNRTIKYKNKIFSINPLNCGDTIPNRDLNVPTNRYIEAKLVERTLIVTGEKFTFKGRFYSRVRKYANSGEDSAPIMLKEINPLLVDSIKEAKQINEPIFLLIASPTGFDKKVTDSVDNETGLCFASNNLSIGLVDMGTGESFFNPHDELTKMCKPLCDLILIDEKLAKYQKFIFELLDKEPAFFENVQYSLLKEQCVNSGYIDAELILKNFRDYAKERGYKIRNVPDVGQVILK